MIFLKLSLKLYPLNTTFLQKKCKKYIIDNNIYSLKKISKHIKNLLESDA